MLGARYTRMRYYELTINIKGKEDDTLAERVTSWLPSPAAKEHKNTSFLSFDFYSEPEKLKELEKKLKEESLKYMILTKERPEKTAALNRKIRKKPVIIKKKTTEPKVELKEINEKLEQILKE